MNTELIFTPLGGIGDVTKNMYLYEYQNSILIVDCGIGFADETMLGVDLLLPDITYLLDKISEKGRKQIVGMAITHGHEDHMGALPFILPQLPKNFPIFATKLTAAMANEKLKEFGMPARVQTVSFQEQGRNAGPFTLSFIRVTHSVPDTSHIFIKTPVGNFYHGSDFKFDLTPADGKTTDFQKIVESSKNGTLCLLSDCLGSERKGATPSENAILERFEQEIRNASGKVIITTYSSNIARLNQGIEAARRCGRSVCFIGRSLVKTKEVASRLGYLQLPKNMEVSPENLRKQRDDKLLLFVAGSQGQENSAMTRIANGEHRDITIKATDTIIFSSDPIPGNEVSVNALVDTIAQTGAHVLYSDVTSDFHVSGHGSSHDLMLLMSMIKPKKLLPIGGAFKQMAAYRNLAIRLGYQPNDVLLLEDGAQMIFSQNSVKPGMKLPSKNVYVDEVTGDELEGFVLRDRQKLSESGICIVVCEVAADTGQLVGTPDIISRGFLTPDIQAIRLALEKEITSVLTRRQARVTNWIHLRKLIGDTVEQYVFRKLKQNPLVLPVVIEV